MSYQINPDDIVPPDSRYVPLQQMPYCCCPTALQMVMLRHNIPLIPAELLGWHLNLTVPPAARHFFYNPRVTESPPPQGYGTQVSMGSDPNDAFRALNIPLQMELELIDRFDDFSAFRTALEKALGADKDVLMCVRWTDIIDMDSVSGPVDPFSGHVFVVDRLIDDKVRVLDPARGAKWRYFDPAYLFKSMKDHGADKAAGLWVITHK